MTDVLTVDDIRPCFGGMAPTVLATSSAGGVPNITYMSRVHPVGSDRVAITNQFMSKSGRNLAENPWASMRMYNPADWSEYRLTIRFERTERRGPIFDRLRNDLSLVAALSGMQDVFELKAADIFYVENIEKLALTASPPPMPLLDEHTSPASLGELCMRISRAQDLDSVVRITLDGMAELLDYEHSTLFLLDEVGENLFTLGSHGFDDEGVGSEIRVGDGVAGMAAAQCTPISVGNIRQLAKYANSIQPTQSIDLPGLANVGSRLAVPALALGQLIGVLMIESTDHDAYREKDAHLLAVIATLAASAIESLRTDVPTSEETVDVTQRKPALEPGNIRARFFPVDGSVFFDGDYIIKGVAGRILWSLIRQYDTEQRVEFTNREVRLDPSLDLPDFRDNFESRLILLKRRLDERTCPVRIEKTGRGRFKLLVNSGVQLEEMPDR